MSTGEQDSTSISTSDIDADEAGLSGAEPARRKLDLDVRIQDVGPCKKHLRVAIPRSEIDMKFEESLGVFQREAQVPGFRPGRAPRSLLMKRFRKQVGEQVKSDLLKAALEQIDEDYQLNPITQPKLDLEAIKLPEEGSLEFEMEIEVRPDFAVAAYQGLQVKRPVRTIREEDVEEQLQRFLERYAEIVPKLEGAAEVGDYLTADLTFFRPDGSVLNQVREIHFRLQPELRFSDGRIPELGRLLTGVKPGESREVEAVLGTSVSDPTLRGLKVRVVVDVHDLKRIRMPEIDAAFLEKIGFDSLDELRDAVREAMQRRIAIQQRQAIRRQILDQLIEATPFDLPSDLVSRQEKSTVARLVDQLREEGLSDNEIKARAVEIRANAHEITLRSLKEFFILSRIAEAENITVEEDDLEMEIESIAARSGESVRRVRARIEKEGMTEALITQILERKALERVLATVVVQDVPVDEPEIAVETLDQAAAPEPVEAQASGSGEGGSETPPPSAG